MGDIGLLAGFGFFAWTLIILFTLFVLFIFSPWIIMGIVSLVRLVVEVSLLPLRAFGFKRKSGMSRKRFK
jgi:hypothetical protein